MKTTTAVIKLVLRTNKKLASGLYPITLCVQFYGRKDKSTGYAVPEAAWDGKNECVKKSYPNASQINKVITDYKNSVINRKLQYEMQGQPYTAAMLIQDVQDRQDNNCANNRVFKDILKNYIEEKGIKRNTIKIFKQVYNALSLYLKNENFIIDELTEANVKKFAKYLQDKQCADATIRTYLSKVAAIYNYAIDCNIVELNTYPFRRFKYNNIYAKSVHHQALTKEQFQAFEAYFINNYFNCDYFENTFTYKNGVYANMMHRWTEEFTFCACLFSFYAQGLAFADIALLKTDNVKELTDNGKTVYVIRTKRAKTNKDVTIVLEDTIITQICFVPFLQTAHQRDNYIYPVLQSNEHTYNYVTEAQIKTAFVAAERQLNNNLKSIISKVNNTLIDHANTYKHELGQLIDTNTTFYAFRHTFATLYMNAQGANPVHLATLMGRSASGIFTYVKELTSIQDILNEKNKLIKTID